MLNRWRRKTQFIALFSALVLLMAACGGGGTGTSATTGTGGTSATTTGGGTSATAGATTTGGGTSATAGPGAGAATATTGSGGAATTTTGAGAGATAAATTGAGAGATAAAGGGATTAAAPCPSSAKGARITMWSPLTGPDGKFMTDLANQFSKANPQGITVVHQPQPDYLTKMNTAQASNSLPEMTVIRDGDNITQAARNILRPIPNDVMSLIGLNASDFPKAVWDLGMYKGQRYSVPLDIHPLVLYYNKDLYKAAGLNGPPTNKAELEKAAAATTKNGVMGWSITTGTFPTLFEFQQLLHQFGGSEFNADGTQVTWNSPAGVQAMQYILDAQKKYSKPSLPQDAGVNAFKQQKSAMEWNGIWQISNLVTPYTFAGAAPVPQLGTTNAVWGGSHQLALFNQKNADPAKTAAAGCWMGWLVAHSYDWAKSGQIPASKSVRASAQFKAIEPQATIAPEVDYVFFAPPVPGIGDAIAPLDQAVSALTAGKGTDAKKALDDAAAKATQILQQNKQRYGG